MPPDATTYKPGRWIMQGTVLGAFLGLLSGRFALGLIFGFFVGVAIDAGKRRSPASGQGEPPDQGTSA